MKKERENSYSMAQECIFSNITKDRVRNFSNIFYLSREKYKGSEEFISSNVKNGNLRI